MKAIGEVAERAGIRARIKRTTTSNVLYMKDIGLSKGFRKFFNSQLAKAEVKISPLIKEMLMGHHIGLDDNYFRPEEQDVQAEYEKAIDALNKSREQTKAQSGKVGSGKDRDSSTGLRVGEGQANDWH